MNMKLGFIGGWGHHYVRQLLKPDQSPIPIQAAVCGDGYDTQAAERLFGTLSSAVWFDDPIRMFNEFQPNAVSIGSIYGHNGDLIAQALRRKIPTVSDKPIAASWEQLGILRDLCRDPNQIVLTEFDFRCRPEFRAAWAAITEGLIGDVVLVTAQKSYRFGTRPPWYAERAKYGGTLLWIASHGIDAVQWVTGRRITQVIGRQGNVSKPDFGSMEDHLAVLMALDNGGSAVCHADYLRPAASETHGDDRLRIAGSEGVIEVRDSRCKWMSRRQRELDITDRGDVRPIHLELLAALRGEESPWFSTSASLSTAQVLLHARDAADERRWIDVK
jgi:predicted dehydrogenase